MSETRSREPLERDKFGHRIHRHDRGGYARGCGCDACTADHAVYAADLRAQRREAEGRGTPGDPDTYSVTIPVKVSQQLADALDERIGYDDTRSGFTRDLLYRELGVEDTARRPARRRPNYRSRQEALAEKRQQERHADA
jgi:hypothetical protein